jgi:hypothetical protein
MKLDDKIRSRRLAYLLKGERSIAFELSLLYYILAKRRSAEDKIADACLKSVQWLKKAAVAFSDDLLTLSTLEQLDLIEQILAQNQDLIDFEVPLVRAIPVFNRDLGLAYIN